VAHLDTATGQVERVGDITYTPRDDVANEFRLSYRVDMESGKPGAVVVVTGSADTLATDPTAIRHGLCEASVALYGRRFRETSSEAVANAATAGRVLLWRAAAAALQARLVTYAVGRDFAHLEPGNVVTVTDPDVGLSAAVGLVESIPWGPAPTLNITVRLLSRATEFAV
jgi:predicted phage tail protein